MSAVGEFLSRAVDSHVWWPIVVALLFLAFMIGAAVQASMADTRAARAAARRSGRHPAGRRMVAAAPPTVPAPTPSPPPVRSALTDADRDVLRLLVPTHPADCDRRLCRLPVPTSLGTVECLRAYHDGPCL